MVSLVKPAKVFLVFVILQALLVVGLNIPIIILSKPSINADLYLSIDVNALAGVLVMAMSLAIVVFALDGLFHENIMQVLAIDVLAVLIVAWGVFQTVQPPSDSVDDTSRVVLLVLKIVLLAFCVIFVGLYWFTSWKIYLEFGWKVYKKIGADPAMRGMYRWYQIFLTFMKVDIAYGTSLVIMTFFTFGYLDWEHGVLSGMMVLTYVWAIVTWLLIKYERMFEMALFYLFALAEPAYVIYKLVRYWAPSCAPKEGERASGSCAGDYRYTTGQLYENANRPFLTAVGCVALLVRVLLIVVVIFCHKNFRKGLKDQLKGAPERKDSARKMTIV